MFDFLKIRYSDSRIVSKLVTHSLLDFICDLSTSTGETREDYCIKSEHKNLSFFIYNKTNLYFRGSLHKYYNQGVHNYNDFSYNIFLQTLTHLKNLFSIEPENCILQNLEIGLNIELPFNPSLLLNNLLLYKSKEFIKPLHADYYQSKQSRYYIKLYDKSKQYHIKDRFILRFEVKYIKMWDLNNKGIYTLADLQNPEKWKICKEILVEKWNHVLFYDTTIKKNKISKVQKRKLSDYSNPHFWRDIPNRKIRFSQGAYYKKIVETHSQNRHKTIKELLQKKWDVLTDISTSKVPENHNQKPGRFNPLTIELECPFFTDKKQEENPSFPSL